jgi:hypothetical protein
MTRRTSGILYCEVTQLHSIYIQLEKPNAHDVHNGRHSQPVQNIVDNLGATHLTS